MNQVNKKLWSLVLLATCGLATADEKAPISYYQSGFYAGLSTGFAQLHGQRTETINLGPNGIFIPSNGAKMRGNGIQSNLFLGYFWRISGTQFALAPEIYYGYGPLKDRLRNFGEILPGPLPVTFDGTIERKWVFGSVIRGGSIMYNSCFLYLLGGIEFSRFNIAPTVVQGNIVGFIEAQTKSSAAFVYGVGIEKQFGQFRIALEPKVSIFEKRILPSIFQVEIH